MSVLVGAWTCWGLDHTALWRVAVNGLSSASVCEHLQLHSTTNEYSQHWTWNVWATSNQLRNRRRVRGPFTSCWTGWRPRHVEAGEDEYRPQRLLGVGFMHDILSALVRARTRLGIVCILGARETFSKEHYVDVDVNLYTDESPQWRGTELQSSSMVIERRRTGKVPPSLRCTRLSFDLRDAVGKCVGLLHQLYLCVGPDHDLMRCILAQVVSLPTLGSHQSWLSCLTSCVSSSRQETSLCHATLSVLRSCSPEQCWRQGLGTIATQRCGERCSAWLCLRCSSPASRSFCRWSDTTRRIWPSHLPFGDSSGVLHWCFR